MIDIKHPLSLSKEERVCHKNDLERLFNEGKSHFTFPIKSLWIDAESENLKSSVIFSVPKRLHKRAVVRNLLKRRMREAYRHSLPTDKRVGKIAILIYISKNRESLATIESSISKIIDKVYR